MRKLLTGILLAAAFTTASAEDAINGSDIAANLAGGMSVQEAYAAASEACGGGCDADILAQMQAAGVSTADAMTAAASVAFASGKDTATVMAAALAVEGVSQADAVAAVSAAATANGVSLSSVMAAATTQGVPSIVAVQGVSASGADAATVTAAALSVGIPPAIAEAGIASAGATAAGNQNAPGQNGTAPGLADNTPGQNGTAPGQTTIPTPIVLPTVPTPPPAISPANRG
jgi:hypothetical protein